MDFQKLMKKFHVLFMLCLFLLIGFVRATYAYTEDPKLVMVNEKIKSIQKELFDATYSLNQLLEYKKEIDFIYSRITDSCLQQIKKNRKLCLEIDYEVDQTIAFIQFQLDTKNQLSVNKASSDKLYLFNELSEKQLKQFKTLLPIILFIALMVMIFCYQQQKIVSLSILIFLLVANLLTLSVLGYFSYFLQNSPDICSILRTSFLFLIAIYYIQTQKSMHLSPMFCFILEGLLILEFCNAMLCYGIFFGLPKYYTAHLLTLRSYFLTYNLFIAWMMSLTLIYFKPFKSVLINFKTWVFGFFILKSILYFCNKIDLALNLGFYVFFGFFLYHFIHWIINCFLRSNTFYLAQWNRINFFKNHETIVEIVLIKSIFFISFLVVLFLFLLYFIDFSLQIDLIIHFFQQGLDLGLLILKPSHVIYASILFLILSAMWRGFETLYIKNMAKKQLKKSANQMLLINYTAYGVIFFIVLLVLGFKLHSLSILIGAIVISVGIGARYFLLDIISGIIIFLQKRIKVGDFIYLYVNNSKIWGEVESINLLTTQVLSDFHSIIFVPNMRIINQSLKNYLDLNYSARCYFKLVLHSKKDLKKASILIKEVLTELDIPLLPIFNENVFFTQEKKDKNNQYIILRFGIESQNAKNKNTIYTSILKKLQESHIELKNNDIVLEF